jgi:hypothetical protein
MEEESWFARNVVRKVGRGDATRFWLDGWMGIVPLCEQFPRLFSISTHKEALICEMIESVDGVDRWKWGWRRNLFAWELDLLGHFVASVPVVPLTGENDVWWWGLEDNGAFSVKSAYLLLDRTFTSEPDFDVEGLRVLSNLWKCAAPSKVTAFSWKLLRNRIPTRVNLAARGILETVGGGDCVHCVGILEDARHLFMLCGFACMVWGEVCKWLGLVFVMPPNLFIFYDSFVGCAARKKTAAGFALIWQTTVWSIWHSRNDVAFANGVKDLVKVIDDIKVLSWRWGMARRLIQTCLFYEWCCEPGICLG